MTCPCGSGTSIGSAELFNRIAERTIMKFFTTEGPVNCQDHYCLPPLERFDLAEILRLMAQKKYFLLHAPRQTGKTSSLLALMAYLNRQGTYRALYANIEGAQAARENIELGMAEVVHSMALSARDSLGDEKALILADEVLASGSRHIRGQRISQPVVSIGATSVCVDSG